MSEYIKRQDAIDTVGKLYRYESDRMTALQELPTINIADGKESFFTNDELLFIHEILGNIDGHLLMHILKDSDIRNQEDLTMLMTRIYNRIDRSLELDKHKKI